MQADGVQRVVDDEPGCLGSVALTEHVRSGERNAIIGRFVGGVELVENCLTQESAVLRPDHSPVCPVVVLLSGGKPVLNPGSVEHRLAAGETADLWIHQPREIVLQDGRSQGF